jgi:hypothetical protein
MARIMPPRLLLSKNGRTVDFRSSLLSSVFLCLDVSYLVKQRKSKSERR